MVSPRLLLPCLLALSALPASARIYCCNDEHGKRVCGDILPAQCQARAYNELNPMGVVKKKYEAPLTPEQRAQRDAELARKKAEEKAAAEQARRDKAMMASYTSIADIDTKRERTVAAARAEIKATEERIESAQTRLDKLRKNAERYDSQKKPLPETLKANLRDSEADLVTRNLALDEKKKELVKIEEHFDHDRRRFIELTSKHPEASAASPAVPAPAR
jgi:uncharacterized protein (DUF342 family)